MIFCRKKQVLARNGEKIDNQSGMLPGLTGSDNPVLPAYFINMRAKNWGGSVKGGSSDDARATRPRVIPIKCFH
jgi:hypothetical protein